MPDAEILEKLSKWYQAQCNGEWEHELGIVIDTIDNPGWMVKVDLRETAAELKVFSEIKINNGEFDWIRCSVNDAKFVGAGDPSKLALILAHFLEYVDA
jgi:hypothetical protein